MKPVCIAIVDSAHARLYSYQGEPPVFREVKDLINPSRRASSQPGLRNEGGSDDQRKDRRAHHDHEFAKQIVEECLELARSRAFAHVIFVSSPRMLGDLRSVSEPLRKNGVLIDELERDLAGLTSPQIHDRLADAHMIDPRTRAR